MRRRGRPEKYPWDQWLDGEDKLLCRGRTPFDIDGTHFPSDVKTEHLRRQIRNKARQRDMQVAVEAWGNEIGQDDISLRFDAVGNGRYDWNRLFDGDLHYLTLGEEITSTIYSFRTIASRAAKKRGHSASVSQKGQIVAIRAVMDDGRPWRRASEPDDAVVAESSRHASETVVAAFDGTRSGGIITGPRPIYDPLEEA